MQTEGGPLYPPDLHASGIDFTGLVVVHIPPNHAHPNQRSHGLLKAAELLLRSGGFGLVVVDLSPFSLSPTDTAWQGRLLSLAREHRARVVLLTEKDEHHASLGPLVSVRIEPQRQRVGPGQFSITPRLLKNKPGLPKPGPTIFRAPWGLR